MIAEFLKLSALFPGEGMTEIGGGVTVGVVSDCRIGTGANLREQVFPNRVTVLINNTVLFGNITVVVIGHVVDHGAVYGFRFQLSEGVIFIFRNPIEAVNYFCNPFFPIILVFNGSAVGKLHFADQRSGRLG